MAVSTRASFSGKDGVRRARWWAGRERKVALRVRSELRER
jgi:hypothetical protein